MQEVTSGTAPACGDVKPATLQQRPKVPTHSRYLPTSTLAHRALPPAPNWPGILLRPVTSGHPCPPCTSCTSCTSLHLPCTFLQAEGQPGSFCLSSFVYPHPSLSLFPLVISGHFFHFRLWQDDNHTGVRRRGCCGIACAGGAHPRFPNGLYEGRSPFFFCWLSMTLRHSSYGVLARCASPWCSLRVIYRPTSHSSVVMMSCG